ARQKIARLLDGDVSGSQVVAPGPGHSRKDRSLSVRLSPSAPDGFIVFSHADDDWRVSPARTASAGHPRSADAVRRRDRRTTAATECSRFGGGASPSWGLLLSAT